MYRPLPVYLFLIVLLFGFTVPSLAHSYSLTGGVHDRSNDPDFLGSNIPGICAECHVPHGAFEIRLWGRDLTPNAVYAGDLCVDCHDDIAPTWASSAQDVSNVEDSWHDFTAEPLASDGPCDACHSLHYHDDTTAS